MRLALAVCAALLSGQPVLSAEFHAFARVGAVLQQLARSPAAAADPSAADPAALPRLDTPLARRWARTRVRIDSETAWLSSCTRGACRDPRATRWQAAVRVVADTAADRRPARVHRLVEGRIRYIRDSRADDLWQTPLTTLLRGAGDCEDLALLKRALLLGAGETSDSLQLLVLRTRAGEGHVALQLADMVLDNRFRAPVRRAALAGDRVAAIVTDQGYLRAH